MPLEPQRGLVVFHLAGQMAALPLESVERIASMAELAHPPGLPSPLEGILNWAGHAVPVVRLDRLLQLPKQRPGLYSMLIVLKGMEGRAGPVGADGQIALLVDRVSEIVSVPGSALLPVGGQDSFNACVEATAPLRGDVVHVLSPTRILLEKERESLSEYQAVAQRRLRDWELEEQ